MTGIDLNADLGEGAPGEAALLPLITSASLACGAHAGEPVALLATLRACRTHGVAVGAHPGYRDPAGFGRRERALSPADIAAEVVFQVSALMGLCVHASVRLRHVKAHGALYHRLDVDPAAADAYLDAIGCLDPTLAIVAASGSPLLARAAARGFPVRHEVFVERRYGADGRLLDRRLPGACLTADEVPEQFEALLSGRVRAADGSWLRLRADTFCLHGDRHDAPEMARSIQSWLAQRGLRIDRTAAA